MQLEGTVALVTGAKRGMGQTTAKALLAAGVAKIYVADVDEITQEELAALDPARAVLLHLDITKHDHAAAAARRYSDISILINNAGVNRGSSLLKAAALDAARAEMEVNYFGTLDMCRAFAPVLKKNGGGAIVNMLSVLARMPYAVMGSYCASKAALLSLTYSMRAELAAQGTRRSRRVPRAGGHADDAGRRDEAGGGLGRDRPGVERRRRRGLARRPRDKVPRPHPEGRKSR